MRLSLCFLILWLWLPIAGGAAPEWPFEYPSHLKPTETMLREQLERAAESDDWGTTPPVRLEVAGLGTVWQVTNLIYAGTEPPGREGMAGLRSLGVRTLVSIGFEVPDDPMAAEFGMQYAHMPISHGRVNALEYLSFLRALSYLEGGYYVHAEPGSTRALVTAAMAARMHRGRGKNYALYVLSQIEYPRDEVALWYNAGSDLSSKRWDDVESIPADFPVSREVPPTVWWMQRFDESLAVLREAERLGWLDPPDAPGTTASYEARVIGRTAESWERSSGDLPADFRARLVDLREKARALEEALGGQDAKAKDAAMWGLATTCMECHAVYRDGASE